MAKGGGQSQYRGVYSFETINCVLTSPIWKSKPKSWKRGTRGRGRGRGSTINKNEELSGRAFADLILKLHSKEENVILWESCCQWTWVWASSGRWWRTGKPGMLQSMWLQRVRHDWAPEQQQVFLKQIYFCEYNLLIAALIIYFG